MVERDDEIETAFKAGIQVGLAEERLEVVRYILGRRNEPLCGGFWVVLAAEISLRRHKTAPLNVDAS